MSVEGEVGAFTVGVRRHPRYVDEEKCTACGTCSDYCPVAVTDKYNEGLSVTKSVHMDYPQGIPAAYYVDEASCLFLTQRECKQCERVCKALAIDFTQQPKDVELRVGAIILAPGYRLVDEDILSKYGYGIFPNVLTSLEFERILSASGPFGGHLIRPSDEREPEKIAWLQCVGSRDVSCGNGYCSAVCCMYAIKEAAIAKEHSKVPLDAAIFFMDMRTHGKDFERYYEDSRQKHGVRFVRSRVHSIAPVKDGDDLVVQYVTETGEAVEEVFDMVVLSVGLATPPEVIELSQKLGISLNDSRFCQTDSFSPVATSREGIYVAGVFQGPKDIPQSVIEASSAAAESTAPLSPARNTLIKTKEIPVEQNVRGKRPRIGVFVCHCGINISSVVDIDVVCDYARTLPFVEYVTDSLYSCAQDSLQVLQDTIAEQRLNRIVVAACSPRTHEPLFQETLVDARLNKYLFEMANIRNQDSWVHKDDPAMATDKAKDLVRMAAAKAALVEPLQEQNVEINQRALVVGGGISGMIAAKALSSHDYKVSLVEKEASLGGQAQALYKTWKGENIQHNLVSLVNSVESDGHIDVRLETEIQAVDGFVGNFRTTLISKGKEEVVEHGAAVIATGATENKPKEYLYGEDARVVTHLELDRRFINKDPSLKEISTAAFIQCVGSREPERPYCSKVCCTHAIESALQLKEINPGASVYVFYRDIRAYGEREHLFRKARGAGIIFIRYSLGNKPQVTSNHDGLQIKAFEPILQHPILLKVDLVVLASAIVPLKDENLAQLFKIPMNEDGFFVEAHAKLAPSEFATDGVFLCGLAHYPKPIDESVAQAQAAASRAMTILAKKSIQVSGAVAYVDPSFCSGCGVCVDICPYSAPSFEEGQVYPGKAEINPVLCKGCGLCVASCRSGALNLKGFEEHQIMTMINEI